MRIAPLWFAAALLASSETAFAQSLRDSGKRCDGLRLSGSTTRISSNSDGDEGDPSRRKFEILVSTPGHCVEARMQGVVKFSDDETTVTELGSGARAWFRERTRGFDRSVEFTPDASGGVRARLFEDGDEKPFDAEARAWLARSLPGLLREAAFDAEARVARYRARGGTQNALREIATIGSGGSQRAHYIALLQSGGLSDDEAAAIVRQASGRKASSGDIRQVLQEIPSRLRRSPAVQGAVLEAVGRMESDGDKRSVLHDYAAAADRNLLLAVLREIPAIDSDGDKRSLLVETSDAALDTADAELRRAWFNAYAALDSDGDKRAVLMSALPYARSAPALTADIIRSVGDIGSDGDASAVLISLAGRGLLTTPELRELYANATSEIRSDSDRRRVRAAMSGEPTSR